VVSPIIRCTKQRWVQNIIKREGQSPLKWGVVNKALCQKASQRRCNRRKEHEITIEIFKHPKYWKGTGNGISENLKVTLGREEVTRPSGCGKTFSSNKEGAVGQELASVESLQALLRQGDDLYHESSPTRKPPHSISAGGPSSWRREGGRPSTNQCRPPSLFNKRRAQSGGGGRTAVPDLEGNRHSYSKVFSQISDPSGGRPLTNENAHARKLEGGRGENAFAHQGVNIRKRRATIVNLGANGNLYREEKTTQ